MVFWAYFENLGAWWDLDMLIIHVFFRNHTACFLEDVICLELWVQFSNRHLYLHICISKVCSLIHTNLLAKCSSLSAELVSPLNKCHIHFKPLALHRNVMQPVDVVLGKSIYLMLANAWIMQLSYNMFITSHGMFGNRKAICYSNQFCRFSSIISLLLLGTLGEIMSIATSYVVLCSFLFSLILSDKPYFYHVTRLT